MKKWTNKHTYQWINEWMNEWMMNEWMNEWTNDWMHEWMNNRKNERMNERTNDWLSEWVDEWIYNCISEKGKTVFILHKWAHKQIVTWRHKWWQKKMYLLFIYLFITILLILFCNVILTRESRYFSRYINSNKYFKWEHLNYFILFYIIIELCMLTFYYIRLITIIKLHSSI